jgi:hypothetical protein
MLERVLLAFERHVPAVDHPLILPNIKNALNGNRSGKAAVQQTIE